MVCLRRALTVLVPVAALAACSTGLSDQDRALLNSANQNAAAAKDQSAQALDAAKAAQVSANNAAQEADRASADASAANEKADRMFQRSLRK